MLQQTQPVARQIPTAALTANECALAILVIKTEAVPATTPRARPMPASQQLRPDIKPRQHLLPSTVSLSEHILELEKSA